MSSPPGSPIDSSTWSVRNLSRRLCLSSSRPAASFCLDRLTDQRSRACTSPGPRTSLQTGQHDFAETLRVGIGDEPYAIARQDGQPMAFAGLWKSFRWPDGIFTTTYRPTALTFIRSSPHLMAPPSIPSTWATVVMHYLTQSRRQQDVMDQKSPSSPATPNSSAPTATKEPPTNSATKPDSLTGESLLARGWTELKPSGKGYGLPMGRPSK